MAIVIIDPMEVLMRFNFFAVIVLSCPAIMVTIIIHLAHKQYSKNHPKPISKDAQIRGLKSCIVNQQSEINDYKKTVADLVRAFALKKARKQLALAVVLGLFVISIVNPAPSLMPLAIGFESNETPFFAAGDGDVSSDSITSFAETLPDDTLYYPDSYDVVISAYAGKDEEDDTLTVYSGAVSDVQQDDSAYMWVYGYMADSGSYININWTFTGTCDTTPKLNAVKTKFTPLASASAPPDPQQSTQWIDYALSYIYNWTSGAFVLCANDTAANPITFDFDVRGDNQTDFQSSTGTVIVYTRIKAKFYLDNINYVSCRMFYGVIEREGGYAGYTESFADVSDWASWNTVENFGSDGDVGYFEMHPELDNDYEGIQAVGLSIPLDINTYVEFNFKTNVTFDEYLQLRFFSGTDMYYNIIWESTSFSTVKVRIKSMYLSGSDFSTIDKIIICGRFDIGADVKVSFDYLRIGQSTKMGWQHDMSTTAGVTEHADFDASDSYSSDGDTLAFACDWAGGTDYDRFYFLTDTTATVSTVESSYYPFWELQYSFSSTSFYDAYIRMWSGGAFGSGTSLTIALTKSTSTQTLRFNALQDVGCIEFWVTLTSADITFNLEFLQAYSIVNVSSFGELDQTSEYWYVEDGTLHTSGDFYSYCYWENDLLSVDVSTYNVWNATCTNDEDFRIRLYVSSDWTYYDRGKTRGECVSGTLTRIMLLFWGDCALSAIKFWEDATDPILSDKWINPPEPYDDEDTTITVAATDGVDIYTVTLNAGTYPTGFNDIDYTMTETVDNELYKYTFEGMTAGYYEFAITVDDGANMYTEYIPFTVRELEIEITTYTFFGASSDFSYMQYSGYINRDCTFNISEWSDSWAKNETHTGSVTEGMFNIAWDKIGVDDAEANFTIIFVNGSLSKTVSGYYGTAYKELRITEIEVDNPEVSQANTSITVNFYANKDIDWYVYDQDDSDAVLASGSSLEGSGVLSWLKDRIPHAHNYAIKWTDGVSNIWFNSSYWTFRENIDSLDQPDKDWGAIDKRRTIEFWTTLTAFLAIGALVVIGISHYKLSKKIKALQLPHYDTQE